MAKRKPVSRRKFLHRSLAAAGAAGVAGRIVVSNARAESAPAPAKTRPSTRLTPMPCGLLGKASISRLMLGGNLVGGWMHCRDLKYVGALFRAYVTEAKMMETLAIAEQMGINTVFETGANFIDRYNREFGGKMQFIPHIKVTGGQKEQELKDHIKQQVDTGAVALYVWGVAADQLTAAGDIGAIGRAVELAKKHNLPVGVGGHSLLVPMECEKQKVPADFYVKTLHSDQYPSATPKELRKEFIWMTGGKGWYDNMWCINPEETIEFMKTVTKPWVAFKVLAAGAMLPQDGFKYAFANGADFIAVGMFDFQVRENAGHAKRILREVQERARPWRA